MRKKIAILLCLTLTLLLLTGCAARDISKARTAYANGDYQTVVELLENLKTSKPEAAQLLRDAKVHLAFEAGDFQQVVDLIGDTAVEGEIAELLEQAKTALEEAAAAEAAKAAEEALLQEMQAAFDAGDYQKVLDLIDGEKPENENIVKLAEDAESALAEEVKAAEEAAAAEAAKAAEEALLQEMQAAFDAGDYQKVLDLVDGEKPENENIAKLAEDAENALAEEVKAAEEAAKATEEARAVEEAAKAAEEALLQEMQAAFDAGDYQKVLDLVDGDKPENENIAKLAEDAENALAEEVKAAEEAAAAEAAKAVEEAKLKEMQDAFDAGDYQKVVEIAGNDATENEAITELLGKAETALAEEAAAEEARLAAEEKLSELQSAFDAGDYQKVVDLAAEDNIESAEITALLEQAETALEEAAAAEARLQEIRSAFENKDYQKVLELAADADGEDEEIAAMCRESEVQLAYQNGDYDQVVTLFANDSDRASSDIYRDAIHQKVLAAIRATGDEKLLQLPADESYLPEPKTMYSPRLAYDWWTTVIVEDPDDWPDYQKVCGPCIPVERVPMLRTGRQAMPWVYEGTEVTVLAEENNMSFILYRSSENEQHAGWVQTRFLVDDFPGELLTIGENRFSNASVIDDITMTWSKKGFLDSQQNYSVLSETVENCVGFTLEYQLTAENTPKWACIFGPRTVYVNDGTQWIRVGSFDYPQHGTVKVEVNLAEPTDIVAIGTIAEVGLPNTFFFRQYATDFRVVN